MPSEILDVDEFFKLSEKAERCSVKRLNDIVKLKIRTPKMLYTLKITPAKIEEIFKKLKCDIEEI